VAVQQLAEGHIYGRNAEIIQLIDRSSLLQQPLYSGDIISSRGGYKGLARHATEAVLSREKKDKSILDGSKGQLSGASAAQNQDSTYTVLQGLPTSNEGKNNWKAIHQ
jgi:hypothetical protein